MNKLKIIFIQAITISIAILFANGIQYVILHFTEGYSSICWPWYIPISYILTGILSSLPTLLLVSMDNLSTRQMWIRIAIHFVITGVVVSGCGILFHWYETQEQYLFLLILYVIVYFIVGMITRWIRKSDERKINEAIKDIRDEE